uniref:Thiol:disulfide interchange protein n=1 Tax=Polysiphonia infestans TaxID=2006978 RepID=A0A1Z1ME46_9FLOR|nr:thiol:disulfide interchange protein [Polysiphonia infestans]ARW64290.1 thiol:disulfide interchange protein [Polysiphonia infestans]
MDIFFNSFFDQYYILLYYLQYYFSQFMLFSSTSNFFVLFILFVLLGLFTIFTPCFASILALSLSYLVSRNNSLVHLLLFIFGLLTSFLTLILLTNTFDLYFFSINLPIFSNFMIFLVSLDLMNIIDLSVFYSSLNSFFNISNNKSSLSQSYLMGFIIGFSSLPCNTSIFIIINFLVVHVSSTFSLLLYLLGYLIGLVVPLILIFSFRLFFLSLDVLSIFWFLINQFAGSLLFIASLLSFLRSISY